MNRYVLRFVGKPAWETRTAFYDMTENVAASSLDEAKAIVRKTYTVFKWED